MEEYMLVRKSDGKEVVGGLFYKSWIDREGKRRYGLSQDLGRLEKYENCILAKLIYKVCGE